MNYYDMYSPRSLPVVVIAVVAGVVAVLSIGWVVDSWLIAPFAVVVYLLLPGLLLVSGNRFTSVERFVLVPVVGCCCAAIATLLVLLVYATGIVGRPFDRPVLVVTVASLPAVGSLIVWALRDEPTIPTVDPDPWLLLGAVPAVLGALGPLVQNYTGVTVQNYVITVLLVVIAPLLFYQADSDLKAAVYLYGFGLGVLLSHSLVTEYAVGVDVHESLRTVDTVIETGRWELEAITPAVVPESADLVEFRSSLRPSLLHRSLPMVVSVPVVLRKVANIPPDYTFKLLYAMLFALAPVGIYRLGREHLSVREALVAGLLFVVYYRYFHTSPGKQHIAQVFLVGLLVFWHSEAKGAIRRYGPLLMSVGILFSHYAVAFLFVGVLSVAFVLSQWFLDEKLRSDFSFEFMVFFSSVVVGWFLYAAGGRKPLQAVTAVIISIEKVLSSGSTSRSAVSVAAQRTAPVDRVNLFLHGLIFAAILVGILWILYHAYDRREPVFSTSIDTVAIGFFGILSFTIVGSGFLGIDRVFDMSLVVLGPVAVLGTGRCLQVISQLVGRINERISAYDIEGSKTYDVGKVVAHIGILFVVVLFVFNSGLAYEASGNPASSAINLHEDPNSNVFSEEELDAARWMVAKNDSEAPVYTDSFGNLPFKRLNTSYIEVSEMKADDGSYDVEWDEPGYIYIRTSAITSEEYSITPRPRIQRSRYNTIVESNEVVYSDRGVVIVRISPDTVTSIDAGVDA